MNFEIGTKISHIIISKQVQHYRPEKTISDNYPTQSSFKFNVSMGISGMIASQYVRIDGEPSILPRSAPSSRYMQVPGDALHGASTPTANMTVP
jgi:hypothetical protein